MLFKRIKKKYLKYITVTLIITTVTLKMIWKFYPLLWFVLMVSFQIHSISGLRKCLVDENHYECKLSTMVPYRNIANYEDSPINYPGCVERKIWLLIRHGTRFPDKKYILRIRKEFPKLQKLILSNFNANKTTLKTSQAAKLAKWKMNFINDDSKILAQEGENEMIDLAERFQSRFPHLLSKEYTNRTHKFKYTATQRAEHSAKNFALGLFGKKKSLEVCYDEAECRDPVLRFYKRCKRWKKEIVDNPDAKLEKEKFITSTFVENMLMEISNRIGVELDFDKVYLMFLVCGFETAFGEDSPWCDLFSLQDFEILEYTKDLALYWKDGYGYPLNYEQACPTLKDMFDFFESNEKSSVVVYFTHSGTILKFLSLIGIAKDETPLTHDSFIFHKDNRAWRSSFIDAFASNIAFVLYECESQGPSILFMHQERVVKLPNCPENMPCPISVMKDMYPDNDEECKFDEMCFNSKSEL